MMLLSTFLLSLSCAFAYISMDKEDVLPDMLLEQLADRMQKESGLSYLDINNSNSLGLRSLEEEQYDPLDYDLGDTPLHPSIRDQEYLRHSTLWGSKYRGDGSAGGDNQRNHNAVSNVGESKNKNTLPAYCNPPNPCPVGYSGEEGCMEDFENTAAFSRRFQDEQDCMCDAEHMFDCPDNTDPFLDDSVDVLDDFEFNNYMRHQMQELQELHQKNFVSKKFNKEDNNPFLTGERLPVAAKKGNKAL